VQLERELLHFCLVGYKEGELQGNLAELRLGRVITAVIRRDELASNGDITLSPNGMLMITGIPD
jgi:hypothetical protein